MDVQNAVRAFLQGQAIVSLTDVEGTEHYNKAGLVPFKQESGIYRFYVMKPVAKQKELGLPAFQLCKGTRMHFHPEIGWRDIRDPSVPTGEKETLATTALREGIEELGVKLAMIERLFDLGPYDFASARTGKGKRMWLFAAQMEPDADFLSDSELAGITTARGWFSPQEFTVVGRSDHHYILRDMETRLKAYFRE